jgi:putative spermidine/putrescine transport system substrate-binding protein
MYQSDLRLIQRREFLKYGAAGMAAASFGMPSFAQRRPLTMANFGGEIVAAQTKAFAEPYMAQTGVEVLVDGGSPLPGVIKTMVESGNVVWDLCEGDGFSAIDLGRQGILHEIDYSVVDKTKIREGFAYPYGAHTNSYSYVIAYDSTKFGDHVPTIQDFFDTAKFPGKRSLWKYQLGASEYCLLAEGLTPAEIYAMDPNEHIARALAKAKSLGDDIIYWDSGSDSQQMFLDEEVVIAVIWSSRAQLLEKETEGRVKFTWDKGMFCPGCHLIPKGTPYLEEAQKFMNFMLTPELQLIALDLGGQGPSNPSAADIMTAEQKAKDPGYPDNFAKQFVRDEQWYADNFDAMSAVWFEGISA